MLRRFNQKLLSLVLAAMMLLGCLPALAEEAAASNIPEGYKLVAENSGFRLYLLESTMAVIVQSKANGHLLYSTVQNADTGNKTWKGFYQSGIVIEYLEDVKDKPIQADFINNASTIAYEYGDNGFLAHVAYTDLGISFDVKVWMDEEGMHVYLPTDSIVEVKDQTYMIVKNDQGREERIDTAKYTKTSEESEFLLTAADGTVYTLSKSCYVSTKDNTVTVKDQAGITQVTLPLAKPLDKAFDVSVINAAGKTVLIPAESVTAVQKNLYTTGTAKDGSALRIPKENVVEISEYSYTIASIYVYPFMGHSRAGEGQGYMIIPDGQGAVVGFEDNEGRYPTPFDKQVYGVNIGVEDQYLSEDRVPAEDVIMPVFGMVHTDSEIAVLSVIEQGDLAARIQAYPNGVRNLPFDWVTAKYTLRFVFNQPMGPSAGNVATRTEKRRDVDILQHFLFRSGEEADYAGLAVAYRNYLIANDTFAQADRRDFDIQIDFLGIERENYILGKQDVVMTSFDQAAGILDDLTEAGVKAMNVTYRGWQKNGLTGGVPTDSFDVAKSLGGKSGLMALARKAADMGVPFALEADVLSLNTETHPSLVFSALKKITAQTWSRATYGKVYETLYYCNPTTSESAAASLTSAMVKEGLTGISFTGITQVLTDYCHKDKYHDTSEMAAIYTGILDRANDHLTTALISPNAYLWQYADVITDIPAAGSDYTYTDAEIPFLTIALSGQIPYYLEYTNFQANTREFFLHLVEQGARPSFLLTWEDPIELQNTNSSSIYSSRYDLYRDMVIEWYRDLSEVFKAVGEDGMIVDHVRQGDLVRVTWSNGTQIYLNFGDRAGEMDGIALEKMSFKVVNGNGN